MSSLMGGDVEDRIERKKKIWKQLARGSVTGNCKCGSEPQNCFPRGTGSRLPWIVRKN